MRLNVEYSFYNPVAISFLNTGEWREKTLSSIKEASSVLFIYSKSALRSVDLDNTFIEELKKQSQVTLLTGIESNPSIVQLAQIRNNLEILPDTIIALGGGSVIDIAKILKALSGLDYHLDENDLLHIINSKEYLNTQTTPINVIALPSTAGTGSELTKWATIWDMVNKKKYSVERDEIYPNEAWVDPSLTIGLSRQLTSSTGLDALCQAIEAYWSTKTNPIVRRVATEAITAIINNLERAVENPLDIKAREGMCVGSSFAALAFSQTRTTACHALSYPLTSRFGIPHGIAVFMSLIPIMKINWDLIEEQELFLSAFKTKDIRELETLLSTFHEKYVTDFLKDFPKQLNLQDFLSKDIESMGDRLGNNPVKLSSSQIIEIYKHMLDD